jgi:hypothetical protein
MIIAFLMRVVKKIFHDNALMNKHTDEWTDLTSAETCFVVQA